MKRLLAICLVVGLGACDENREYAFPKAGGGSGDAGKVFDSELPRLDRALKDIKAKLPLLGMAPADKLSVLRADVEFETDRLGVYVPRVNENLLRNNLYRKGNPS